MIRAYTTQFRRRNIWRKVRFDANMMPMDGVDCNTVIDRLAAEVQHFPTDRYIAIGTAYVIDRLQSYYPYQMPCDTWHQVETAPPLHPDGCTYYNDPQFECALSLEHPEYNPAPFDAFLPPPLPGMPPPAGAAIDFASYREVGRLISERFTYAPDGFFAYYYFNVALVFEHTYYLRLPLRAMPSILPALAGLLLPATLLAFAANGSAGPSSGAGGGRRKVRNFAGNGS